MRSLVEYISSTANVDYKYPDDFAQSFDRFLELNSLTEDTVTPEQCTWFAKHVCEEKNRPAFDKFSDDVQACKGYVTEMLQTTDINLLVKRLNKVLGGDSKTHVRFLHDTEHKGKEACNLVIPQEIYDKDLIEDTCDKLMWTITQVYTDDFYRPIKSPKKGEAWMGYIGPNQKGAIITVEPTKADDVTDYVKKDCGGILYHFTSEKLWKSIQRTGLRMKGENNDYRFTKNKVFFVCADDEWVLGDALHTVGTSKGLVTDNELHPKAVILKIDASKYNVNFYRDTMYGGNEKNIVYSYAYFPPQLITDVTQEIKDEYFD